MSWLVVFIPTFIPVVLLSILIALNWLQREHGARPVPLRLQNVRNERVTRRGHLAYGPCDWG
jgi:hypothetical protein